MKDDEAVELFFEGKRQLDYGLKKMRQFFLNANVEQATIALEGVGALWGEDEDKLMDYTCGLMRFMTKCLIELFASLDMYLLYSEEREEPVLFVDLAHGFLQYKLVPGLTETSKMFARENPHILKVLEKMRNV